MPFFSSTRVVPLCSEAADEAKVDHTGVKLHWPESVTHNCEEVEENIFSGAYLTAVGAGSEATERVIAKLDFSIGGHYSMDNKELV